MKEIISKEQFVNILKDIKNTMAYDEEISNVVMKYNGDYDFWPPNCVDATIDLLEFMFNDYDGNIPLFLFDLEFGEQWYPEAVDPEENNGEIVFLRTPEELYDFLISRHTEEA